MKIIEGICAGILGIAFIAGIITVLTLGVMIVAAGVGFNMPIWVAALIVVIVAISFVITTDQ